ncbi:MAG: glycosyltransferase family 4 protein [Alphaproteobacteria bacterium]
MKLALLLARYFPHGGLQRGCLTIAGLLGARGHEVEILTAAWRGERPEGVAVRVLGAPGLTNHGRLRAFARASRAALAGAGFDAVVGFDRVPGLDLHYVGDRCYQAGARRRYGPLYRLTPRYRTLVAFEGAVFRPQAGTEILLPNEAEREAFQRCYGTPAERFHPLPPGIPRDRRRAHDAEAVRRATRAELGVSEEERLLLVVASGFHTKGLDRALRALAALAAGGGPKARLVAIGDDEAAPYERLARRLGLAQRVRLLPGRDDIPRFLVAADLLVHAARKECMGAVLLEAAVAGLPVLCSAACGYAWHVEKADAGRVLPEPFRQAALNSVLAEMLASPRHSEWARNGVAYGARTDLFSGREVAAELIERLARERRERAR